MARRTNLYQRPRSPLIQGRTRWERPLWQAWLVGAAASAGVLSMVMFVRTALRRYPFVWDAPLSWLIVGAIVGSAAGSLLARLWGWRLRWIGAVIGGLALGSLAYVACGLLARGPL